MRRKREKEKLTDHLDSWGSLNCFTCLKLFFFFELTVIEWFLYTDIIFIHLQKRKKNAACFEGVDVKMDCRSVDKVLISIGRNKNQCLMFCLMFRLYFCLRQPPNWDLRRSDSTAEVKPQQRG